MSRSKREIVDISDSENWNAEESLSAPVTGQCSRHSVKINFEDIGWTHILAPKQVSLSIEQLIEYQLTSDGKIDYYYCEGDCQPVRVGPEVFTTSAAYILFVIRLSLTLSLRVNSRSSDCPTVPR